MVLEFEKYHGTGNDFILVDSTQRKIELSHDQIAFLCDRHFGIGADGLIKLTTSNNADFRMIYYNSDGKLSSMCGNGGRCIANFAYKLGLASNNMRFEAVDGMHKAFVGSGNYIELEMKDISNIEKKENVFILNTGSPHYVKFVDNIHDWNIIEYGKKIRYSDRFKNEGINVNLVSLREDGISLLTYERGVENETLSCGTGVTAAAIAASIYYPALTTASEIKVFARGGELTLKFKKSSENHFQDIYLCGLALPVFSGKITL